MARVPAWIAIPILSALMAVPSWASNPGEPIDCSDFIALEPGYHCTAFLAHGMSGAIDWAERGSNKAIDNEGRLLILRAVRNDRRIEIRARLQSTDGDVVLGYFPQRRVGAELCDDVLEPSFSRWQGVTHSGTIHEVCSKLEGNAISQDWETCIIQEDVALAGPLVFDPINGRLLISLDSHPYGCGTCSHNGAPCQSQLHCGGNECRLRSDYSGGGRIWIASIGGFTALFETLQSYEPISGPLSFRVPYMPEGFQYADWFDTYYGSLVTVGDWSQLQPLQCGYPASPPSVGDYLTVTDTLPTPAVGQGYYYVTAVTHQGQTRWGRQASGGVLSGRDPTALPGCTK